MENWIDAIIKFMLVSSAFLLAFGGVSFFIVHVFKIRGRARLWICSAVVMIPLLYPLQALLPNNVKIPVPLETIRSFYSRAFETEPGNKPAYNADTRISETENALFLQSISKQIQPSNPEIYNPETLTAFNKKSFTYSINWKTAIAITWIALFILILIRFVFIVKKTRLLLKCADCVTDPYVTALLQKCSAETGLRRTPRILVVDHLLTPMAVGIFHPAIVLPARLLEPEFKEGLRFTLLHELKHLQRHDNWWLLFESLVNAAYFFHPVIYWAKQRIHEEWEYICDNHVIKVTNKSASYADFLLHEIWNHGREMDPSLAVPFILSTRKTSKRVYSILDKKRPTLFTKIRDRIAITFISLSFISLLLCSVTPSAHVREDEMSPNKVTPVEDHEGYNVSNMMGSLEEPDTGLSNNESISEQKALEEQKIEESSEVVRNPVTAKPEPSGVSFVSESTQALKKDAKDGALRETEKDDAESMTSSINDMNSSDAAKTDNAVLQEHAGRDMIDAQAINNEIPKEGNILNPSRSIDLASSNVDGREKPLQPGGDYSMEVQADKNTSNGNEKTVSVNMDNIPQKYNLDTQLERATEISKYNFMSWDNVDNQSFVLQTGPGDYYLIVLSRLSNKLMFSETIGIPDTNAMIKPGFNDVIVPSNGFEESYIINRIYKFKDYEQVKAIKAQLRGNK